MRGVRNTHDIAVYRDREWAERGEVTLTEAASILNLSPATVLRQIRAGIIPAQQLHGRTLGYQTRRYRRFASDRADQVMLRGAAIIRFGSEDPCLSIA
ncbi:helix-turn-helix domain-containing protein [Mesorhizobium sp. M0913]|uniref:helix-turn-helix domain-containing protein n=1 Tax=Mesorhizobium sp. M0913 TaxID=2957026 RepID=UPI003338335B